MLVVPNIFQTQALAISQGVLKNLTYHTVGPGRLVGGWVGGKSGPRPNVAYHITIPITGPLSTWIIIYKYIYIIIHVLRGPVIHISKTV